MRVVVFGDMEGVAGICRWAQVSAGDAIYEEGRELYTAEINAAVARRVRRRRRPRCWSWTATAPAATTRSTR